MEQQYFYRPLRQGNGAVLKCAGICTKENRQWFPDDCKGDGLYLEGVFIAPTYLGDRIPANTQGLTAG